jgi:hypothetical protein
MLPSLASLVRPFRNNAILGVFRSEFGCGRIGEWEWLCVRDARRCFDSYWKAEHPVMVGLLQHAGGRTLAGSRMSACGWLAALMVCLVPLAARGELPLQAGFAEADITPEVAGERPVWLAGYGTGRRATGVHDPLLARCAVLKSGDQQIGLVSVDLIGLQFPVVQKIRQAVPELDYVLVSSTHNHEGPDVIGIWGPTLFKRGVDSRYLERVEKQVVQALHEARGRLRPVTAAFGTASQEALVKDSRRPYVKDSVLRALKFLDSDGAAAGLMVVWSCHPEAMGSRNTEVTADFPATTVQRLKQKYGCPVVYFSGAVGGLMAPPRDGVVDAAGVALQEGQWEYAARYGELVAGLAEQAIDAARPIALTPLMVARQPVLIPVSNPYYRSARALGVVARPGFEWTGDFSKVGEPIDLDSTEKETAIETEVACLRLGALRIAAMPGEVYPELVYGRFQEPVDPAVDFPEAPLERSVKQIMPSDDWMLLGLANDELGYIIPKRQWDQEPPFAYGRISAQYGEINSCNPQVAPILMEALQRTVRRTLAQP